MTNRQLTWSQRGKLWLRLGIRFVLAALAVWMHGRSGDLCVRDLSAYAMTPGDLTEYLPRVFGELLSENRETDFPSFCSKTFL